MHGYCALISLRMEHCEMAQGIDADMNCAPMAAEIARNYQFIGRYYRMPPPYSDLDPLTRTEAQALTSAGLFIVSLWEYISGSKMRIGSLNYRSGLDEGARAYAQAVAIPQPAGTPIYFAVDDGYDPSDATVAGAIDDYFRGVSDGFVQAAAGRPVDYKIGVYGPGAVCDWLKGKGRVSYTWLAYAPRWPGSDYAGWNIQQSPRGTILPFDHDEDKSAPGDVGFWKCPPPAVA
jgi:hypothetical protein